MTSKIISNQLKDSINFYNSINKLKLEIKPEHVATSAFLIFFISLITITCSLIFIIPYFSFLISVIISVIISRKVYYYPILKYKIQKNDFLQYLDLVYQDFLIVLKSNGTIFDCVKYVSQSNYPIISNKFKNIIEEINFGSDPETLILEFVNLTGINSFKEKFLPLLNSNFNKSLFLNENPEFSLELTSNYQKYTKQLNTRITIIITSNIFSPLFSIIIFSFYFVVNSLLFLILVPIHLFLLLILKKALLRKDFFIFGDSEKNEDEFNSLIIFLILFSNYLKINDSPENALIKSIKKMNDDLNIPIDQFGFDNGLMEFHLEKLWKNLLIRFKSHQSKILLNLILRMLYKDSSETGLRIENIINNIKLNRKMISKRKVIIKSLQLKSLLLLLILSCLIGLLTTIIPIIGSFFQIIFTNSFNFSIQNEFSLLFYSPLLLTYSIIIISTSIVILNIVQYKRNYHFSIFFFISYALSFYGSFILINSYF
ncbi:MAG: hypothetical protein GF329_08105 [Candidatus Lokiarchaeota archaeon]|nr:hypothetical protein [Candidatus Lokiarchaeota archaeon]